MSVTKILSKQEIEQFLEFGHLSESTFDNLYDYYLLNGEMPYGVAKARDGDPWSWIADKLYEDLI